MEAASKIITTTRKGRRTTVLNRPSTQSSDSQALDRIKNGFMTVWEHLPARLKRVLKRLVEPRVLLVLGILLIAASAVGFHFYTALSTEIDARLQRGFFDDSTGIFSSPFAVRAGDRLSMDELSGYLRHAGYRQEQPSTDSGVIGKFSIEGRTIEIIPGKQAAANLGLRPISIQVGANDRVERLTDLQSGRALTLASIEGELLASVRDGDRRKKIVVQFKDIPATLRDAVLAIEDRRFFEHSGIDWRGIARAFWVDINQGEAVQGGSTITQQLIKNSFLSADRSFKRKLKEAAMAVILESRLSKEDIFTQYCNDVYLGQSGTYAIHGFAEATKVYFDKELSGLTLAESAFLAGMVHAPNRYSARRDPARAIERRGLVLDGMVAIGAIAPDQAEAAKQEPLNLKKRESTNDLGTNYFIDYAERFVEDRYGNQGLDSQQSVYLTMDPRLQRAAHEAVNRHAERLDRLFAGSKRKGSEAQQVQAALVALDAHTGEVLAMIGGRSYDESQLNRATDAKRQPGSAFKPFVYATALSLRSFTPATLLSDRPQAFSYDRGRAQYKPSDYHGGFTNRDVTLREALARSLNVPAVELAMRAGLGTISDVAENCGLDRPRPYPSMALGTSEVTPLQLAGAYTVFVNDGLALRPIPVRDVRGLRGAGGIKRVSATSSRAFSPQVAYLMTDLLQSVVDSGTAARLRSMGLKGAIAGKTGTSDDGWFVGYTPNLICAVWVGFDNNRDLKLKASETALPIWADFVKEALDLRPSLGDNEFHSPGGVVTTEIDPTTGYLATPECPDRRKEKFIAGTEPFITCSHELLAMSDESLMTTADGTPLPGSDDFDYSKIALNVCALTGRLASIDCPNVRKKTFELGKEPVEMCASQFHREKPVEGSDPEYQNLDVKDDLDKHPRDKSEAPLTRRGSRSPSLKQTDSTSEQRAGEKHEMH